jgi:hypothetical protein
MYNPTKEELAQQWDRVYQWQRKALTSPRNSSIVTDICRRAGLPEKDYPIVRAIAGWVILELIQPFDVSNELQARGVERRTADNIQYWLDRRIYSHYHDRF